MKPLSNRSALIFHFTTWTHYYKFYYQQSCYYKSRRLSQRGSAENKITAGLYWKLETVKVSFNCVLSITSTEVCHLHLRQFCKYHTSTWSTTRVNLHDLSVYTETLSGWNVHLMKQQNKSDPLILWLRALNSSSLTDSHSMFNMFPLTLVLCYCQPVSCF